MIATYHRALGILLSREAETADIYTCLITGLERKRRIQPQTQPYRGQSPGSPNLGFGSSHRYHREWLYPAFYQENHGFQLESVYLAVAILAHCF